GVFNTNPLSNPQYGSIVIPRNYADAYGQLRFNLRVGRSWGFGERVTGRNTRASRGAAGFGRANRGSRAGSSRGGRSRGGASAGGSSGNRYTLNLSAEIQNVFNTVNTPAPVTNLSSPFIGQSLAGGGANALANRRVRFSFRFQF